MNLSNSDVQNILRSLFWKNFRKDLFSEIIHIKIFREFKIAKIFPTNILSPWSRLNFSRKNSFRSLQVFLNETLWIKLHETLVFHCVKSVQMRSFFCSVFSGIRTEYGEIRSIWFDSILVIQNKRIGENGCCLVTHCVT